MNKTVLTFIIAIYFLSNVLLMGFKVSVVESSELPVHNIDTELDYETIQGAIDAHETLDGHTIRVEAGIYYENIVISKRITVFGENRSTVIDGRGIGSVVSVEASNVTLSGFTVQNSGKDSLDAGIGIEWGWDTRVEENSVRNCHDGIAAHAFSSDHLIINNNITNCSHYGIAVVVSFDNTIEGNTLTNNNFSLTLAMTTGNIVDGNNISDNSKGIYLYSAMDNIITDNSIRNNGEWGIFLREFSSNNTVVRNEIVRNEDGVEIVDSSDNRFYHNKFVENRYTVNIYGYGYDKESNIWYDTHSLEGNFWSGYNGVDTDGDGIGENLYTTHIYGHKDPYPLVLTMIDQIVLNNTKCDPGDTVTLAFHVKLHPNNLTNIPSDWLIRDSSIVGAIVHVNGTRYVTNGTGWISFKATYDTPGKRVWNLNNCYRTLENPLVEWTAPWTLKIWSLLTQWWFWIIPAIILGAVVAVLRMRPKPPAIQLEEGEFVIKQFHGGRGLADEEKRGLFKQGTISLGRWYVTNRRLIYEGKIQYPELKRAIILPGWTKKETDVHSYPLSEMKNIEIVDKGFLHGKQVEITLKTDREDLHVQVLTRKREEFVKTIQIARNSSEHTKESSTKQQVGE